MEQKDIPFSRKQTAECSGAADNAEVCWKSAGMAELRNEITGALIGLARSMDENPRITAETWQLMIEGLLVTACNGNFREESVRKIIDRVHAEKARLAPDCAVCAAPCGRNRDYDIDQLRSEQENVRNLKMRILDGACSAAISAYQAMEQGKNDQDLNRLLAKALFIVGEDPDEEELLAVVTELGERKHS